MLQPITRQLARRKTAELESFHFFQAKFSDCPRSQPVQPLPPRPDLLFRDINLGIEITEYSLGQSRMGSHARRLEVVRRKIVSKAQLDYELSRKDCLQLSVFWANLECPTKSEEKVLAESITQLVLSRSRQPPRMWRIGWEEFDNSTLQKLVAEISIYIIAIEGQSCWSSAASIWAWEADKRIQVALDQKESKVRQYRKFCTEIWLLVVANREWLSCRYFRDPTLAEAKFRSSFDRAFFLDEASEMVCELALCLPSSSY